MMRFTRRQRSGHFSALVSGVSNHVNITTAGQQEPAALRSDVCVDLQQSIPHQNYNPPPPAPQQTHQYSL